MGLVRTCWLVLVLSAVAGGTYYPDYSVYHDVDGFYRDIRELPNKYPDTVALEEKSKSLNGEALYLVRLTDHSNPTKNRKIKIMITFGEHAREFLPVESFFKLVRDLSEGWKNGNPDARFILANSELLLVGLVNPDGRRRLERTKDWCWRGDGNGVDVNRNMGWEWGGPGSSNKLSSEEYRGERPFSEPESRMVRDVAHDEQVHAYLSMHTGAQFVFVPYGDTKSKRTKRRHATTNQQLSLAADIWASTNGFFTGIGVVYDMNDYTADGTIADYMGGVLKLPVSLTFELYGKPGDLPNCFEQFNPDNSDLAATLDQMHPLYNAAFIHLIEKNLGITPPGQTHRYHESDYDWQFVQGKDSPGGDLYHVDLTKGMKDRIVQLKEMCARRPDCAGFATSGYLKKTLVSEDQMGPWPGAKAEDGTYIKMPAGSHGGQHAGLQEAEHEKNPGDNELSHSKGRTRVKAMSHTPRRFMPNILLH